MNARLCLALLHHNEDVNRQQCNVINNCKNLTKSSLVMYLNNKKGTHSWFITMHYITGSETSL